jgi:hypothetical protein
VRPRSRPDTARSARTIPLTWEDRVERRRRARRRLRNRRLGALAGTIAFVALAAVLLTAGGGGGTSRHLTPALEHAARRQASKPAPPKLLPRGGRTVLPGHLVVAYYGIIGTSNILGQTGDPEADAAGVERRAHLYVHLVHQPVQPAFELVTTIATPSPGGAGTYSSPIATATVARYLRAAHRHKLLLILDFQPGRGEFLPGVRRYRRFLLDPAVGVALDPEWKLQQDEVPDQVIGSSSAASINAVSSYLSQLVTVYRLPQKLFVVHEFRTSELPDREHILFRTGLATVLQMDGLGPVATKLDAYRQVMRGALGFNPGFKLFLRPTDDPVLLSPPEVLALHPRPEYISYQ